MELIKDVVLLMIGSIIGVFVMCLMQVSADTDEIDKKQGGK